MRRGTWAFALPRRGGASAVVALIFILARTQHVFGGYIGVELFAETPPPGFIDASGIPIAANMIIGGGRVSGSGLGHPLVWSDASHAIDFSPTNAGNFITSGMSIGSLASQQVGAGQLSSTGDFHALIWAGSPNAVLDINPVGYRSSHAEATDGIYQVGYGQLPVPGTGPRALMWSGRAESAVDLHPSNLGFFSSTADGVGGGQIVGAGRLLPPDTWHAVLWTTASAQSAIDLHPANLSGITDSALDFTNGAKQVGVGWNKSNARNTHTLVWSGTADSAVNLNPAGYDMSEPLGFSGNLIVGEGLTNSNGAYQHALLWNLSDGSVLDLQALLPSYFTGSAAYSMDAAGNIFGTASGPEGNYIVEWQATPSVPEPAGVAALIVGLCGVLLRKPSRAS